MYRAKQSFRWLPGSRYFSLGMNELRTCQLRACISNWQYQRTRPKCTPQIVRLLRSVRSHWARRQPRVVRYGASPDSQWRSSVLIRDSIFKACDFPRLAEPAVQDPCPAPFRRPQPVRNRRSGKPDPVRHLRRTDCRTMCRAPPDHPS